jgi:hypothetical protein
MFAFSKNFLSLCYYESYRYAIFVISRDIYSLGCRLVVWTFLTYHSHKVIKISALRLKENFCIILKLKDLVAQSGV